MISKLYLILNLKLKLLKMLVKHICRTCNITKSNKLHELNSPVPECPEKTLFELILEITNINSPLKLERSFPQSLCDRCCRKLRNAYEFVTQARQVHNELLRCLEPINESEAAELLEEPTIEVFSDIESDIKMELDVDDESKPKTSQNDLNSHNEIGEDLEHEHSDEYSDPLFKIEDSAETQATYNGNDDCNSIKYESCNDDEDFRDSIKSSSSVDQSSVKRKRKSKHIKRDKNKPMICEICGQVFKTFWGYKTHGLKHSSIDNWYSCHHCDRKFYLKDSLNQHLKMYRNKEPRIIKKYECAGKEATSVDTNVCRPHGKKIAQCKICLENFKKIIDLRKHLEEHKGNVYFGKYEKNIYEKRKLLYPRLKCDTIEQLKAQINYDLNVRNYENLCSITNEAGYELSIDSSDTESESETNNSDVRENNQREYACELCNQSFQRKYKLFEHQRHNHDWLDAKFMCERCNARFVNKDVLEKHYQWMCRNMNKKYICKKCPMRFRWKSNLDIHKKTHERKEQLKEPQQCPECGREYADQKAITFHMRTAHGDKSKEIRCKWCERKFYRRDYYLLHLKRHDITESELPMAESLLEANNKPNGLKIISCKLCDLHFESISELRAHIRAESKPASSMHRGHNASLNYVIVNESGYELDIDDSETDDENNFVGRKCKNNTVYKCDLCELKCDRKYEMMQHQRSMHRFDKIPHSCEKCVFKSVSKVILEHHSRTLCNNSAKKFICRKCGYKFMWPENLDLHMTLQHGIRPGETEQIEEEYKIEGTNNSNEASTEDFICPHCDRPYKKQFYLDKHIEAVHINGDGTMPKNRKLKKPYLCSECGRACETNAKLTIHMRMHTGEKPFGCDLCDKSFRDRASMMQHRRIHTGEKQYPCTVCGKHFARYRRLRIHMLTHNGLRPYKCDICDKTFRYSYDLKHHNKQHEKERKEQRVQLEYEEQEDPEQREELICSLCGGCFTEYEEFEQHQLFCENFDCN